MGQETGTEDIDTRLRSLEMTTTRFAGLFDSPAGPGLLSSMKEALLSKIDAYASTVNTFIAGEPARKQHIENNAKQSAMDVKYVADVALRTSEEKQMRLHEENRSRDDERKKQVEALNDKLDRHEKFVQRGIGVVIAGQVLMVVGLGAITVLTFVGGFLWWIIVHAHDIPVR